MIRGVTFKCDALLLLRQLNCIAIVFLSYARVLICVQASGAAQPAKVAPWRPRHVTGGGGSVSAMMEAGRATSAKKIAPPPGAIEDPAVALVKKYKAVGAL